MKVVFYEKSDGTKPAEEFLDKLPPKMRSKMLQTIYVLEKFGIQIREPYSKPLGNGIFELRVKLGSDIARSLYFFVVENLAVITNGFIKKTQKTPRREIELAKKYRKDYFQREMKQND